MMLQIYTFGSYSALASELDSVTLPGRTGTSVIFSQPPFGVCEVSLATVNRWLQL